ncbi:phosphotransferase family protein [Paenibacillus silvisoli]|uniref:phosphotransferase family protein n=1 Tax=Paenibacillus silvisoli TaxID=3110539 RepID=UPI002804AE55|nr:aminoglycoside phosphotransferase family protein [Paenibacillus silvisoli]
MKPQVTRAFILAAVEQDFGPITGWEAVAEGEESQAFAIRQGNDDFILRVNRSAEGFRKDDFCSRRFASTDLPIPEIVSIGMIDEDYSYCISRRAIGITLQDMPVKEMPAIAEPVMRALEALAAANVDGTVGYGPFDENGNGRFASWRDFIMNIANPSLYDWDALKAIVDEQRIAPYFQALDSFAPRCPEMRQLVHGDFGSNNVLTDAGRITGVIDWSEAMFGDPLYDVANLFFWRSWLDCMEAQAQYLEQQYYAALNAEALRCYQLRIGLDVIYHSAVEGDMEVLTWGLTRCDEIVAS